MREEEQGCLEEQLSALLDDELELSEKRAVALHVAHCPSCARTLGELYAVHALLQPPQSVQAPLPRGFWRGVQARLNEIDGLIRATELLRVQPRPLLSPRVLTAAAAMLILGVIFRLYWQNSHIQPTQLTRLHLAASLGPYDPGQTQAVGARLNERWQPISYSVVNLKGVSALQTIYLVDGLPVSVFRLPPEALDISRFGRVRVNNNQLLYLAGFPGGTIAAKESDTGWDVVVSRSGPQFTAYLCLTCPREEKIIPSITRPF